MLNTSSSHIYVPSKRLKNTNFFEIYDMNFNTSNSTPVIASRWGISGAASFSHNFTKMRSIFSLKQQLKKSSHL